MGIPFYRIEDKNSFFESSYDSLIRLLPVKGFTSLFFPRWMLETVIYALVSAENIHISGATGTGKSALIEGLYKNEDNFSLLANYFGYKTNNKKLKIHPIPVSMFESPDLIYRRAIVANENGAAITIDEKSLLIKEIENAAENAHKDYHFIWLVELGRVLNETIQGALVLIINKSGIYLPYEKKIINYNQDVGFITDSNYVDDLNTYSLVDFDAALKRRFSVNVIFSPFGIEETELIMAELCKELNYKKIKSDLITKTVMLVHKIRMNQSTGKLSSLVAPSISSLLAFFKMAETMPVLNTRVCAFGTLLGNASSSDLGLAIEIYNSTFGNIKNENENQRSILEKC